MENSLLNKLNTYVASNALPMHMPGHKRSAERFPWLNALGSALDITEIDGFDNLNDPQGIFLETGELAARLWGARYSFPLVNGSTSGILAAVKLGLCGGELLMSRNCHKSLYNAAELMRAEVSYIVPQVIDFFGIFGSVTPEKVKKELNNNPKISMVAITSPTYEGVISDVASIAEVCHKHGALLLVDEAHGAHLGFGEFPKSAVKCGADLVVQSLHKTLPSLTQTAVLHICTDRFSREEAQCAVSVFQSSSPSYLLSASIDGCVRYMNECGERDAKSWLKDLKAAKNALYGLKTLKILTENDGCIFALDPSKIVIGTSEAKISGPELMTLFRRDYAIELEMAAGDYVVAMTSMGDTKSTISRFTDAVLDIDKKLDKAAIPKYRAKTYSVPPQSIPCFRAEAYRKKPQKLRETLGKISAEYVWAYPPGIPIIVPGERITPEVLDEISADLDSGLNVRSTFGTLPNELYCAEDQDCF